MCGGAQAIISFCSMQLQMASVFFTFSLGTRTHYFGRTILHGGAKVKFSKFLLSFSDEVVTYFTPCLDYMKTVRSCTINQCVYAC
jgi:hypothetical protein